MPRIKGWKKIGESGDNIYWETKKKSKTYKGQPYCILGVGKHVIYKDSWTFGTGEAPISMPRYKTKEQAIKHAINWMKTHPNG